MVDPTPQSQKGSGQDGLSVILLTNRPLESIRDNLNGLFRAADRFAESRRARGDGYRPLQEIFVILHGREGSQADLPEGHPLLRLACSPVPTKSGSRNWAALNAKGTYLYFLDDDVTVPEDFFNRWNEKVLQYPSLMVIGGPNRDPEENTPFQRSVGYVLGSWWGAGRMSERYRGLPDDRWVDDRSLILCNLCFHRDVFHRMGLRFHDQLFYNEENLLLQELIGRGIPLLHSPALAVRHARRGTWSGYARQIWHSGKGRGQMTRSRASTVRAVYLLPSLFLLSLPLSFFMPAVMRWPLALYAFLTAAHAFVYGGRTGDWRGVPRVVLLTVGGHVVYGMGFFRGFFMGITDERHP